MSWPLRSLFVAGGRLFICNEDFTQLSSRTSHTSSAPYFLLESCCSISDVSEMVTRSFSLLLSHCSLPFIIAYKNLNIVLVQIIESQGSVVSLKINENRRVDSVTWKIKWCSTENALKFVTLLNALHPNSSQWPLVVRYRR